MFESTLKRIERIAALEEDIDNMAALYGPLVVELMPLKRELDMRDADKSEYVVELKKKDWPDQYEAVMKRCIGLNIAWV